MTNPGPFLWNGSSKIQFFTDFSTFSVRGCWGPPMFLFWKLIHETQNLLPPEATRHHNSTKLLIFLPLRADLLCNLHYETPCMNKIRSYSPMYNTASEWASKRTELRQRKTESSRHPEGSTNQTYSSSSYFRISWILMERPFFSSRSFHLTSAGPQKHKHKIGHTDFTV